ncbi:MAG: 2-succinyl-5-enolpyruvyl-6-hydroxy-3-cyclohexene-carboxylic-acid synthase [Pseudomonadota bacterium]|jgi:2-succinyl-5-enolpyruvyl-6-hydroxy-3-cyclohexene-1-carboxylate synthase
MNLTKAAEVIEFVRSLGVVDFCLCAGARNSPFITVLDENRILLEKSGQLYSFFEERSAAFFALGRAQQTQKPVAIITTSGTAATELISTAVEAYYTQTPLIFITADRPPSYRQTGAPQSIEQLGIFSHYSLPTIDLDDDLSALKHLRWSQKIPLHLNVCFSEPLLTGSIPSLCQTPRPYNFNDDANKDEKNEFQPSQEETLKALDVFFHQCRNPLFLISGLSTKEQNSVRQSLENFNGAWWIESLSGLRGHPSLEASRIKSGERFIQHLLEKKVFDGVIRIGSVPTTRIWRDLEERFLLPVLTLANSPFSGLARASTMAPLACLSAVVDHYQSFATKNFESSLTASWRTLDNELTEKISATLASHPRAELSLVRKLSQLVGEQPLYLGNSLPVREWDWIAQPILSKAVAGNRGANGIDGQLSSYYGWMPKGQQTWALLGDLTTLYDLSAPWILSQLSAEHQNFTLVIMNNSGGQIFQPMFGREAFINKHSLGFSGWAQMWGLSYSCLDRIDSTHLTKPPHILELRPDEQATLALRAEIDRLWKTHLL